MDNVEKCSKIVDIIFEKVILMCEKDVSMSRFSKSLIAGTSKSIRVPMKDYLKKMPSKDVDELITKISEVCKNGS